MVKTIYNVKYKLSTFDKKTNSISSSREDLNYLASSMDEVKKLLNKDIKRLFTKSEKPKLQILKISKAKGVTRSSQVFNVPNNINLMDIMKK